MVIFPFEMVVVNSPPVKFTVPELFKPPLIPEAFVVNTPDARFIACVIVLPSSKDTVPLIFVEPLEPEIFEFIVPP